MLAGLAEAGSGVYVIKPGGSRQKRSGSSPKRTQFMDEKIPVGKLYLLI